MPKAGRFAVVASGSASLSPRRVMVVVGTRPDAIKLAPVIRALNDHPLIQPLVVSTGQHREMLDQVLSLFDVVPDSDLAVMQHNQRLDEITARVLAGMTTVLRAERPDAVVVQGDTTTSMAAALAAFYERIPVVHVEAGLRSGDMRLPFPEEGNRRLVSVLADLHLAPTGTARQNLLAEGVAPGSIVVTGNTVIDALLWVTALPAALGEDPLPDMSEIDGRPVVLVTAHRRESWGLPLRNVGAALADVARAEPDAFILVPIHRNAIVRESLLPELQGLPNVRIVEPLSYASFCRAIGQSRVVVTDSGGVQEEAPSLGKPVLVLRDVTERPEGVEAGTARLVGTDRRRVRSALLELLRDDKAYARMAKAVNPYGDGRAATRTADAIGHLLGLNGPARPFAAATIHRSAISTTRLENSNV